MFLLAFTTIILNFATGSKIKPTLKAVGILKVDFSRHTFYLHLEWSHKSFASIVGLTLTGYSLIVTLCQT